MRYIIDHDLHIHTRLSKCANDPAQTPEAILDYAEKNNFHTVCITDHFLDEDAKSPLADYEHPDIVPYAEHTFEYICRSLPLPESKNTRLLFGCEADMSFDEVIAISENRKEFFDFMIVPINHLHFIYLTRRPEDTSIESHVQRYYERFDALLRSDMPFHKTGLAHIIDGLGTDASRYVEYLELFDDKILYNLFSRAATLGLNIEVNFNSLSDKEDILKKEVEFHRIALKAGCKFYLGSDAHTTGGLAMALDRFEAAVDLIGLKELDKSPFVKK